MSQIAIAPTRFDFLPADWPDVVGYALRTWLTCAAALYVAFFLQVEEPFWAGMTVWILAQRTPGMTLSRSVYRILGTVVGIAMGVVLIALFSQTPELFILGLALWIGGCTVVANLLRNFRSYGAVLAGYTAAVVSLDSYAAPNTVFDVAMARGAATIIGIFCSAVSAYFFTRQDSREKVIAHLREVIRACVLRGALAMGASIEDRIALGAPLVGRLLALDSEVDFAAAESAAFRIHANGARLLLVHLLSAISAKRALEGHLNRVGEALDPKTRLFHQGALKMLERASHQIDGERWGELQFAVQAARTALSRHLPESMRMDPSRMVSSRFVLDRLDDLFRHLGNAVESWRAVQGGWKSESHLRLDFDRDERAAWIRGARAFVAMLAAGAFWIATAWPTGAFMLIQVGVVCSLFSSAPEPEISGEAFLRGVFCAAVAAFLCNFFLLQSIDGFPLFALVLALCLVPIATAGLNPRTAGFAIAYCVNFMVLSRPLNSMDYDVAAFLNNSMAIIAGVVCGVLAYKLIFPLDHSAARRAVLRRIRAGLCALSRSHRIPPAWKWETRMYDQINRVSDASNRRAAAASEWFEGGLAVLDLGNDVIRLRQLLEAEVFDNDLGRSLGAVIASFALPASEPLASLSAIRAADMVLVRTLPSDPLEARRAWFRARGLLAEMEAFFIERSNLLHPARE